MSQALIERAVRNRYRFDCDALSNLTVEDLFRLPLSSNNGKASLTGVAIRIGNNIESLTVPREVAEMIQQEGSKSAIDVERDKAAIVAYIIRVLREEAEARNNLAARRREAEELSELIHRRKTEERMNAPLEELQKRLDDLNASLKAGA